MNDLNNLRYIPEPERPRDFDKKLAEIVGLSPTGEPWVRFVWGMDRTKWYGGREDHVYYDPHGKYVGLEGHVMEGWNPPEVYDRQEWENTRWGMFNGQYKYNFITGINEPQVDPTVDVLGPFPSKGVWDMIRMCFHDGDPTRPMSYDDMLDLARRWHANNQGANPKQRALDDYLRFNDMVKIRRREAFEAAKAEQNDYNARELEAFQKRADYNKFNFATDGAKIQVKKFSGGKAITEAGLEVPASAIEQKS